MFGHSIGISQELIKWLKSSNEKDFLTSIPYITYSHSTTTPRRSGWKYKRKFNLKVLFKTLTDRNLSFSEFIEVLM